MQVNKRSSKWADGKSRTCGFDLGGGKTCRYKTSTKSNMSSHKKTHNKNVLYTCPECDFKTKSRSSYDQHKHLVCTICSRNIIGAQNLISHTKLHPTPGKIYSAVLERAFDGDREVLTKGGELDQQVRNKFGSDSSEHNSHFHVYMIMFPIESMAEYLKEFVAGIWYPGHGEQKRHYSHTFVKEQNPILRQFYDLCYNAGVHSIYFKPFQTLTAIQSAIVEAAIIKSIDVHNLANEYYGNVTPKIFADWTMDDLATLGAYYLYEAFQFFKATPLDQHKRLILRKTEVIDQPTNGENAAESGDQSKLCVEGKMNVDVILKQLQGMSGEVKFVANDSQLRFESVESEDDIIWDEPPVKKKR